MMREEATTRKVVYIEKEKGVAEWPLRDCHVDDNGFSVKYYDTARPR